MSFLLELSAGLLYWVGGTAAAFGIIGMFVGIPAWLITLGQDNLAGYFIEMMFIPLCVVGIPLFKLGSYLRNKEVQLATDELIQAKAEAAKYPDRYPLGAAIPRKWTDSLMPILTVIAVVAYSWNFFYNDHKHRMEIKVSEESRACLAASKVGVNEAAYDAVSQQCRDAAVSRNQKP